MNKVKQARQSVVIKKQMLEAVKRRRSGEPLTAKEKELCHIFDQAEASLKNPAAT